MTKSKSTVLPSRNDPELGAFTDLMHAVCVFLLLSGHTTTQLGDAMRIAMKRAAKDRQESRAAHAVHVSLSRILYAWHNEKAYLSNDARPRPIPLRGTGATLERLTREFGAPLEVGDVRTLLAKHGLVRTQRRGQIVPTGSVVRFRARGAELTGYLGRSILNLMSTMQSNLYSREGNTTLLERAALVKELPSKDAKAFRRYSAEQGESFTENINGWLESRNGKCKKGRAKDTVTAGVHVFAFIEKNENEGSLRKRSARP
jgi:hypothetical protein